MSSPPSPTYTTLTHPYSPHPLNTLDIHTPTTPPLTPSYHLIYIHGGAFRDPLVTSTSIIPSLPSLFSPADRNHIAAVVGVNYRLSAYPGDGDGEGTGKGEGDEEGGRNVKWPTHIEDVRAAVVWMREFGGMRGEWVVCGHSVGGTMGMMLALQPPVDGGGEWGDEGVSMEGLRGVVSIEGIYDFVKLRDAHLGMRELYEGFISGAFGAEGWERGNVVGCGRGVREGVEVVVVVHSQGDELVEWEQAEAMVGEGVGVLVEVEGRHQEVVTEGKVIGRVVREAVGRLVAKVGGGT